MQYLSRKTFAQSFEINGTQFPDAVRFPRSLFQHEMDRQDHLAMITFQDHF